MSEDYYSGFPRRCGYSTGDAAVRLLVERWGLHPGTRSGENGVRDGPGTCRPRGERSRRRSRIQRDDLADDGKTAMNHAGEAGPDPRRQPCMSASIGAREAFATEWRSGQRPRIDTYLAEVPETERSALLGASGGRTGTSSGGRRYALTGGVRAAIPRRSGDGRRRLRRAELRATGGRARGGWRDWIGSHRLGFRRRRDRRGDARATGDPRHGWGNRGLGIPPARHAVDPRVRDPGRARAGRHGGRLPGPGGPPQPPLCPEDDPRRGPRRGPRDRPVPRRGGGRRQAERPQHRPGLQHGRMGRTPLPGAGICGGG